MMWLLISIMKRCAEWCSLQLYQTSSSMVKLGDDDDDDGELLLWNGWLTKEIKSYFQLGPLSEILIIADLPHTASRIWTCAQSELCSSDNHYTTMPLMVPTIIFIIFWDFLMFYQTWLSPQVKRCTIITYKHGIYEFPRELPNDLRLRISGI